MMSKKIWKYINICTNIVTVTRFEPGSESHGGLSGDEVKSSTWTVTCFATDSPWGCRLSTGKAKKIFTSVCRRTETPTLSPAMRSSV